MSNITPEMVAEELNKRWSMSPSEYYHAATGWYAEALKRIPTVELHQLPIPSSTWRKALLVKEARRREAARRSRWEVIATEDRP